MKLLRVLIISLFSFSAVHSVPVFATPPAESDKSTGSSSVATLSFDQIKTAAEGGDADAQYALGYMYYYGKNGATKDTNLAKNWITKAATKKQPQAVRALALMNNQQNQSQQAASTTPKEVSSSSKEIVTTQNERDYTPNINNKKESLKRVTAKNSNEKKLSSHKVSETVDTTKRPLYTLQLLGASQKTQIEKLLRTVHLENKASIYQTTRNGKNWYVLLYGKYDSRQEAQKAMTRLEARLETKPWIKPYSSIKTYKKL